MTKLYEKAKSIPHSCYDNGAALRGAIHVKKINRFFFFLHSLFSLLTLTNIS